MIVAKIGIPNCHHCNRLPAEVQLLRQCCYVVIFINILLYIPETFYSFLVVFFPQHYFPRFVNPSPQHVRPKKDHPRPEIRFLIWHWFIDLSRLFCFGKMGWSGWVVIFVTFPLLKVQVVWFMMWNDNVYIYRSPVLDSTLPKTKIAPGNRPSRKENSMPTIHFAAAMLDLGRVCIWSVYSSSLDFGGNKEGIKAGAKHNDQL